MDERDDTPGEAQVKRLMEAAKAHFRLESITQSWLSTKIDESNQTITNWKKRGIPQEKLLALSRKLGCSPDYIEFGRLPQADEASSHMKEPEAKFSVEEAQRLLAISDEARVIALAWDQLPDTLRAYVKGIIESALAINHLKQASIPPRSTQ